MINFNLPNVQLYVATVANTVYIGFCDQPPSHASRSLNLTEAAKLSGFPLGIATRRSLKAIFALIQTSSTGYNDLNGRYFTIKDPKFEVAKYKVAIYVLPEVCQGVFGR